MNKRVNTIIVLDEGGNQVGVHDVSQLKTMDDMIQLLYASYDKKQLVQGSISDGTVYFHLSSHAECSVRSKLKMRALNNAPISKRLYQSAIQTLINLVDNTSLENLTSTSLKFPIVDGIESFDHRVPPMWTQIYVEMRQNALLALIDQLVRDLELDGFTITKNAFSKFIYLIVHFD